MNHEKETTLRVPPQSVEAEQSVLGGIMLVNEKLYDVADLVKESDFYRRDHRLIFRAMQALAEKNQPLDAVTLGEWFENQGLSEQIGGTGYLIELASSTPSAANVRAYAQIVRDKAMFRQVIEQGTKIINMGYSPEGMEIAEVVGASASMIGEIIQQEQAGSADGKEAAKAMWDDIMLRYNSTSDISGIATGFAGLDELLGGLLDGRVYGFGGRAKMGKSVVALNVAEHACIRLGKHTGIWTMEMGRVEMMQRMACSLGRIKSGALKHPKLMDDMEWAALQQAMVQLKDAPLTIFDRTGVTIEVIEAQARVLKAKGNLDLMLIDYLGLMELPNLDRHDLKIAHVTRAVKNMAGRLGVPVILVFQLNRGNEQGTVRIPRPSDARDSGSIEQDLDAMMLLHRPSYYDKNAEKGLRLEVALQRNGPTGVVRLEDNLGYFRFDNSNREWVDQDKRRGGKGRGDDDGF